jgi:hypothetical protein
MADPEARLKRPVIVLFLLSMIFIHGWLWWSARDRLRSGYQDFTTFYAAGRILASGQGAHMYDSRVQQDVEREFAPRMIAEKGLLAYIHPPIEGLLFLPFSKLPYFQSYLLWVMCSASLLLVTIAVLRRRLPALQTQPLWLLMMSPLAFFPVFFVLFEGQDGMLLLLLFALSYSAMRRKAHFLAGCWLGLGMFRFQLILPMILILALRKFWRVFGGFALTTSLMILASLALVGWNEALQYPRFTMAVSKFGVGPWVPSLMPNLRGFTAAVLRAPDSSMLTVTLVVILSVIVLWLTLRYWRTETPETFDLSWSLAILAVLLICYYSYVYDLSLLIVPGLLSANYYLTEPERKINWKILGPIVVVLSTPVQVLNLLRLRTAFPMTVLLLVLFWLVARELSARRSADRRLQVVAKV